MVTIRSRSRDETGQDVEQRRLAGAGAAGDQAVEPGADAVRHEVEHRTRQCLERDQVIGLETLGRKPADGKQRAIDRQRRDDGVDTGAVRQTRIHHRRAFVHTPADAADDAVDDSHQMAIVLERCLDPLEPAGALDEDVLVGVDENVADARIAQERFERPEAEHFVEHFGEERFAFAHTQRR